jgi:hypothetical protein
MRIAVSHYRHYGEEIFVEAKPKPRLEAARWTQKASQLCK